MIDIEELKRLYQAVTNPPDSEDVFVFGAPSMEAASAIVSAAPALLAELEAARRVCEIAAQLDREAWEGEIEYQTAVDLQAALAAWEEARGE